MPNPTIYLSDSEEEWIANQPGSRSGVIREALEHYREAIDEQEESGNE